MQHLSDVELMERFAQTRNELKRRGLGISVGEFGEKIAIDYFNKIKGLPTLAEAPRGTRNIDAISRDGERYSIKTVQTAKKTGTVYSGSDIPGIQLFEYMLILKLDNDLLLSQMYRLSWSQFLETRAWDSRMNAWYVPLSIKRLTTFERLI